MQSIIRYITLAGIFAVPAVVFIVSESMFFPFITGKNFTFRILVEIITAGWLLLALRDASYRPRFSWILGAFAALCVAMFLSDLGSPSPQKSFMSNFERMDGYVTLIHTFAYFVVTASMLQSRQLWHKFFGWNIILATILASYGLLQATGQATISQGTAWRIDGTFGNSTYMAIYMLFMAAITLLYTLRTKTEERIIIVGISTVVMQFTVFVLAFQYIVSKYPDIPVRTIPLLLLLLATGIIYITHKYRRWIFGSKYTGFAFALLFAGLIFLTGTRGTVLGLLAGGGVALIFLAIERKWIAGVFLVVVGSLLMQSWVQIPFWVFGILAGSAVVGLALSAHNVSYTRIRRIASAVFIVGIVFVSSFIAMRNTDFVKNTPALDRLTHISLSEGGIRFTNWGMAWEGVKERPIFGWGHESFNYVFNKHYDPAMYGAEEWYDRAHNIIFDWLVQGGFVGAGLYFGLIGITLYLLIMKRREDEIQETETDLLERALCVALLVAYTVHNFFVFDNLISYIYFAIILAYIHRMHMKKEIEIPLIRDERIWASVAVPIILVVLTVSVYGVNIPGIRTAQKLITTLQTQTVDGRLSGFEETIARNSFGNQEVREQLLQFIGQGVAATTSEEGKMKLLRVAEQEIAAQIAEKPGDARIYILAGGLYRSVGLPTKALEYYEEAIKLTPEKTSLKHELGLTYFALGDTEKGFAYLKDAYEKDTSKMRARMVYALGAIYAGKMEVYDELISEVDSFSAAVGTDFLYSALYERKEFARVRALYASRLERNPKAYDTWKNLAIVTYNMGDIAGAIKILEEAKGTATLADTEASEIDTMIAELKKEKK